MNKELGRKSAHGRESNLFRSDTGRKHPNRRSLMDLPQRMRPMRLCTLF